MGMGMGKQDLFGGLCPMSRYSNIDRDDDDDPLTKLYQPHA